MTAPSVDPAHVHELVRAHQGAGRALLYTLAGTDDVEVSSLGAWVVGVRGDRYLDLGSFSVYLLGHAHPRVVAAVSAQIERLPGSSRALPAAVTATAAAAVAATAPPGLSKVMLLGSGADAVEAAIKLARARTGRATLVHLAAAFHGKTTGALSLTDASLFKDRVGPLLADVVRAARDDPAAAAEVVTATAPAAVFVEPVQGEGGVFEVPSAVLVSLREACDAVGALLVFDEIQCGLGRTGELWAHQASGVVPDVLLAGKALGGGVMPASALIATPDAFGPFDRDPLLHTSTFGGHPLAAAAVEASLAVIGDDDVPGLARRRGAQFRAILQALADEHPRLIAGVSGRGLLLGLHCRRPDISGELLRAALSERVLITPCLTAPQVLRVTPPAVIDDADVCFAEAALHRAVRRTAAALEAEGALP